MKVEELKELVASQVSEAVAAAIKEHQPAPFDMKEMVDAIRGAKAQSEAPKGITAARMVRALAAAKGDPERAAKWAEQKFGADDAVAKALSASNNTEGGVLIPPEWSGEIIELLRPQSVFRRMNPVIMPMPTGSMSLPKQTAGATASYIGENQNIPKTQGAYGDVSFNWKKLAALVPISNDLIRFDTRGAGDQLVRDDLVAALSIRQDLAFIRNDGSEGTPKGLRYWVPSGNVIPVNATVNLANVTEDLGKAVLKLEEGLSRMLRPGWLFSPRTGMFLMNLRDGNGNFAYRDEMRQGQLAGLPFAKTIQIPNNLGGGDESEIYLADFADVVIGESETIMLDVSTEASYIDENGTLVSAFSKDQTVIRAIALHDLGVRHEESLAVLTAVDWGA